MLDELEETQVIWETYTSALMQGFPLNLDNAEVVWRARVPLICFSTVHMQYPDRVLKQFGLKQHIPSAPSYIVLTDTIEMWQNHHASVIVERHEAKSRRNYMACTGGLHCAIFQRPWRRRLLNINQERLYDEYMSAWCFKINDN